MMIKKFSISPLKLLLYVTKIAGIPIYLTKTPKISSVFVSILGIFIFGSNIVINGPRGINLNNFKWMKKIQHFDSPMEFFKKEPDAMLQFVVDSTTICFFITGSVIHIIFIGTILLSQKWKNLAHGLKAIQKEMNLSEALFRNFQKLCMLHCSVLILVYNLIIFPTNLFFNWIIYFSFHVRISRYMFGNILILILILSRMKDGNGKQGKLNGCRWSSVTLCHSFQLFGRVLLKLSFPPHFL